MSAGGGGHQCRTVALSDNAIIRISLGPTEADMLAAIATEIAKRVGPRRPSLVKSLCQQVALLERRVIDGGRAHILRK